MNNTDISKESTTDSKEVVRSLVEKIPEKILEQTKVRDKKVTFREEIEHPGTRSRVRGVVQIHGRRRNRRRKIVRGA